MSRVFDYRFYRRRLTHPYNSVSTSPSFVPLPLCNFLCVCPWLCSVFTTLSVSASSFSVYSVLSVPVSVPLSPSLSLYTSIFGCPPSPSLTQPFPFPYLPCLPLPVRVPVSCLCLSPSLCLSLCLPFFGSPCLCWVFGSDVLSARPESPSLLGLLSDRSSRSRVPWPERLWGAVTR